VHSPISRPLLPHVYLQTPDFCHCSCLSENSTTVCRNVTWLTVVCWMCDGRVCSSTRVVKGLTCFVGCAGLMPGFPPDGQAKHSSHCVYKQQTFHSVALTLYSVNINICVTFTKFCKTHNGNNISDICDTLSIYQTVSTHWHIMTDTLQQIYYYYYYYRIYIAHKFMQARVRGAGI